MKRYLLLLSLLLALPVGAATYYCSPAGGGSGASFSSLMTLPSSLGAHTYIIIEGSYGNVTFTASGGTLRKASAANSAVAGYSSTLHDGQAVFGTIFLEATSATIDGVTRNESNWKDGASYGIRASTVFSMGTPNGNGVSSGLTLQYADLGGTYSESYYSGMGEALYLVYGNQGTASLPIVVRRCFLHNSTKTIVQGAGLQYVTFEYNWFGPSWGKEALRGGNYNFSTQWVVRHNWFWNACQYDPEDNSSGITAEIGIWDWADGQTATGFEVYGNCFFNQYTGGRNAVIVIGGNGTSWRGGPANGTKIYNNTFAGIADTGGQLVLLNGTSTEAKNNLVYSAGSGFTASSTANNVTSTSDPFVAYSSRDYRIVSTTGGNYPRNAGANLGSTYQTDRYGTTRGGDGTWDAGAYEYDSGVTANPPVITSSLVASGTNGIALNPTYTISVSNAATSYGSSGLPLGLSRSSDVISGTPTWSGTTNSTITATNGGGYDSETLVWTIYNGLPPTLTTSPVAKTNSAATGVSLTSVATSTYGTPTYQWQSNSVNISGATSANYSKIPANATADSGNYRVVASNQWGAVTSSVVYVSLTNSTAIPVVTVTNYAGNINVAVSSWFSATENPTAYAVSNLPTGLSVYSNNIVGTPTVAQTNVIVVYATNANGVGSNTATYSIASVVGTNIQVGSRVAVNISPSLRVRDSAALAGTILGEQSVAAEGTVTGGPTTADGYTWWEINYDSAPDGWSIEGTGGAYWLIVAPPGGDTTAPSISVTSPTSGMVTNRAVIAVTGTASDAGGVASVSYRWTWPDGTLINETNATGTTAWSFSPTLQAGSNYFLIKATDTSSNTNTTSLGITYVPARRVTVGTLRIH